jgi:hypothetical protein
VGRRSGEERRFYSRGVDEGRTAYVRLCPGLIKAGAIQEDRKDEGK